MVTTNGAATLYVDVHLTYAHTIIVLLDPVLPIYLNNTAYGALSPNIITVNISGYTVFNINGSSPIEIC